MCEKVIQEAEAQTKHKKACKIKKQREWGKKRRNQQRLPSGWQPDHQAE